MAEKGCTERPRRCDLCKFSLPLKVSFSVFLTPKLPETISMGPYAANTRRIWLVENSLLRACRLVSSSPDHPASGPLLPSPCSMGLYLRTLHRRNRSCKARIKCSTELQITASDKRELGRIRKLSQIKSVAALAADLIFVYQQSASRQSQVGPRKPRCSPRA